MRKLVVVVALALSLVTSGMAGAKSSHRPSRAGTTMSAAASKRPATEHRRKKCHRRSHRRCKRAPKSAPPGGDSATTTAIEAP